MIPNQIKATNECIHCKHRKDDGEGNLYCGAEGAEADLILCNTRQKHYEVK